MYLLCVININVMMLNMLKDRMMRMSLESIETRRLNSMHLAHSQNLVLSPPCHMCSHKRRSGEASPKS